MDAETFSYRQTGRNQVTLLVVLGVWSALLAAILLIEASAWLMAGIGAFTLPAVLDLLRNPASGLDFTSRQLRWFSGRRSGAVDWTEIDWFRLDTRLDLSVRASAVLKTGRKIQLPYECTPPHELLEAALNAHGIRTERQHFSLIG